MAVQNYPTELYKDLKQMLGASVARYGEKALFMQKRNGSYKSISYRKYYSDVNALGTELLARGFGGKRIVLIGENCYAWATAYMAVICGVGTVVPVDKQISAAELSAVVSASEAGAVIASKSVSKKLSALPEELPVFGFDALPELIARGRKRLSGKDYRYLEAKIDSGAMASLIFTSGTTGASKGVMLSHRNLCFNLYQMCKMIYIGEDDVFLSVLPLHHAYECTCGFLCPIYRGSTVAFSEGLRSLTCNLQEVQPTVMLCVPLLVETVYNKIWAHIRAQDMEKKVRSSIKLTNALHPERVRMLAKKKVFSALHQSFGGKLRLLISGGSALDPAVPAGLRDFGINVRQGYGLTECAPIAALNRDLLYRDGSVGMAAPDGILDIYDVQNDGTGEIRFKGENVMLGYYNMPEETARVLRNGWLYTGDIGYLDEKGFLYIIGRKINRIVAANGKYIFPEELEAQLLRTPFVKEAVVVGKPNEKTQAREVVALVHPDYDALAQKYGSEPSSEEVRYEMQRAITTVNATFPAYKHLARFVVCPEEFPKNTSRKIKRSGLVEKYL